MTKSIIFSRLVKFFCNTKIQIEIAKVQTIATLFVNVNSINAGQFCDTLASNDNVPS